MNIGLAIKSIAVEKGMTAAALSRATGISEGYLSQLFHAKIEDPQLSAHGTPQAILRHCVSGVVVDRDAQAVVVTLPIADKKRAPTREGLVLGAFGSPWAGTSLT